MASRKKQLKVQETRAGVGNTTSQGWKKTQAYCTFFPNCKLQLHDSGGTQEAGRGIK